MRIILNDRKEYIVSTERGEKLKKSLLKSSDGFVNINGAMIKKSTIVRVEPGGYTEPDRSPPMDPSRQLKATNRSSAEQERAVKKKISEIREIIKNKGFKGLKKKPLEDKL